MMDNYDSRFQLQENPHELYYISKYVVEHDRDVNPKIIQSMIELLVNDYLQNASEKNIFEVFDLLISLQDSDIDWNNAVEINDLLEKYY